MKRCKLLADACLAGLFPLGTGCNSMTQDAEKATDKPIIPQTPIGKLLTAVIDAVNSGDASRIHSFVADSVVKKMVVEVLAHPLLHP